MLDRLLKQTRSLLMLNAKFFDESSLKNNLASSIVSPVREEGERKETIKLNVFKTKLENSSKSNFFN